MKILILVSALLSFNSFAKKTLVKPQVFSGPCINISSSLLKGASGLTDFQFHKAYSNNKDNDVFQFQIIEDDVPPITSFGLMVWNSRLDLCQVYNLGETVQQLSGLVYKIDLPGYAQAANLPFKASPINDVWSIKINALSCPPPERTPITYKIDFELKDNEAVISYKDIEYTCDY